MTPKRIEVIRLFEKDFIDDKIFDCNKVPIDSCKWVSVERNFPDSSGVFFVKNQNESKVHKAIYLHSMPYKVPSRWFHTIEEEFIDKYEITHWMAISMQQILEES